MVHSSIVADVFGANGCYTSVTDAEYFRKTGLAINLGYYSGECCGWGDCRGARRVSIGEFAHTGPVRWCYVRDVCGIIFDDVATSQCSQVIRLRVN